MREFLFRGKRVDNGEWVYGFLTKMWGAYHIIYQNDENCAYPIDPETVGQFTGLTDKNNVKIFEGDIVKVTIGMPYYKFTYHSHTYKVTFDKGIFEPFYSSDILETEIIGNIHDNPELLEENKENNG